MDNIERDCMKNIVNLKKYIYIFIIIIFISGTSFVLTRKKQEILNIYAYKVIYKLNCNKAINASKKIENSIGKNNELGNFYLNLQDSNGKTQSTHPKILKFKNKWNGYKYWVGYTPYPYGNSERENPCVMASNDLIKWNIVNKNNIPLDIPNIEVPKKRYNSDTHLVYVPDSNSLEIFWRYVDDIEGTVTIYRRSTKDGKNWTEKEILLKDNRKTNDYVSPAIIYENGKYLMWYVDQNINVRYREYDIENKVWSKTENINFTYKNSKLKTWHLDVIKTKKGYESVMVSFEEWTNRKNMKLYYSKSSDNINWTTPKVILKSKHGGLYRSSILFSNNNYYILYSEITRIGKRGIGIAYGSDINNLSGLKIKNINKFREFIKKNG